MKHSDFSPIPYTDFHNTLASFPLTYTGVLDSGIYMLDDLQRKIIHYLQGDLPLTSRPFARLARKLGIGEDELLERIRLQKEEGILRRFGANLNPQVAGFKANAMIAWNVPEDKTEEIGAFMASFKEVSHCYQRTIQGRWKYNLFTMVHAKSKKECEGIARRIAERTGINDYVSLLTLKEYKNTSPQYF